MQHVSASTFSQAVMDTWQPCIWVDNITVYKVLLQANRPLLQRLNFGLQCMEAFSQVPTRSVLSLDELVGKSKCASLGTVLQSKRDSAGHQICNQYLTIAVMQLHDLRSYAIISRLKQVLQVM